MNLFHWICIAMLTLLVAAGLLDMTMKEVKGRQGKIIIGFYIIFLTSIILSAVWR